MPAARASRGWTCTMAMTAPQTPAVKPADRSISPSSRTKIRPIARIMTGAPWVNRLAKLSADEERAGPLGGEEDHQRDQAEHGGQRADVAAADLVAVDPQDVAPTTALAAERLAGGLGLRWSVMRTLLAETVPWRQRS